MDALATLRQAVQTLTPANARIAAWYVSRLLSLNDWWRSALVRTLTQHAQGTPVPHGPDLDRTLGTPDAWTDAMRRDISTIGLCAWLSAAQEHAVLHGAAWERDPRRQPRADPHEPPTPTM